jgi:hypothetical protein
MSSPTKKAVSFPKLHACWLQAPSENTPGFGLAYKNISIAVQTALRQHLAVLYFADLKRFHDLQTAFPMLTYQVSHPYRAKTRSDLTYDVLNPRMLTKLIRRARKPLIRELARVQAKLHAEQMPELAAAYEPKQIAEIMKSVKRLRRSRKCINLLIRGEGVLVDALVEIGGMAALPPRQRGGKLTLLAKKWDLQLRRLYPGRSFQALAPVLLDAATKALKSFLRTQPVLQTPPRLAARPGRPSPGNPAKPRRVKPQLRRL